MRETQNRTLISRGMEILLLVFLWIPCFPLSLLLGSLIVFRLAVHLLARILRPDLIPINNCVDNMLAEFPSRSRAVCNGSQVWYLQGKLELSVFRKHFYATFFSTPELRKRYRNLFCHFVQWGPYCFKKAAGDVNLEERIQEKSLVVKSDKDIHEFVGKWLETNDYGEKPNWESLLLHTRSVDGNDERTIVLFKEDHGLFDGYTSMHLVATLCGVKLPYLVKDESVSLSTKVEMFVTLPRRLADIILSILWTQELPWGDRKCKEFLGMFLSFSALDMEKVKTLKRLAKCHFNTVFGVIQALALKKFFLYKRRVGSPSELPEYTFLPSPTAWPGHPAITGWTTGNHMSLSMFRVSLREEDPAVTLLKGEDDFLRTQASRMSELLYLFVFKFAWGVPPMLYTISKRILIRVGLLSRISHGFSPLMLSHEPCRLLGLPVQHFYFPLQPLSVVPCVRMVTIPVSNGGRLDISIGGRTDSFETQEELDYFSQVLMKESLEELLSAFVGPDSKREGKANGNTNGVITGKPTEEFEDKEVQFRILK